MSGDSTILRDLAIALSAAALTTVVFRKLRQPMILGYLVAGMLVGRNFPYFFTVNEKSIHDLAELGVVVILFCIGLELSLTRLLRLGATVLFGSVFQIGLMIWLGYAIGKALGWTGIESFFLGSMLCISSTVIVAKSFEELKITGRIPQIAFGMLIVEDVVGIFLLAVLSTLTSGNEISAGDVAKEAMRLGAILAAFVAGGLFVVPRMLRFVAKFQSAETLLVSSVGLCFGGALLIASLGYSPALGAFLMGALIAEAGFSKRVESLVNPIRDVLAAVFFVSIGMLLSPTELIDQALIILLLSAVVVAGKLLGGSMGAFLGGENVRTSIQVGMSLSQIGEFSFLIAEIGTRSGTIPPKFHTIAVGVCAVTSFLTPMNVGAAERLSNWIDRRMPRPLQVFVSLYASWIDKIRRSEAAGSSLQRLRRFGLWLAVDALLMIGIIVAGSFLHESIEEAAMDWLKLPHSIVRGGTVVAGVLLLSPFLFGVFRLARAIAAQLAEVALPPSAGGLDLGRAPRSAFIATLQLLIVGIIGIPILAATQPFLPPFRGGFVFAAVIGLLAVAFWRSIRDMYGHARAGAEVVVQALASQAAHATDEETLTEIEHALPGVGSLGSCEIAEGADSVGQSLKELNLRGATGATAIAVLRESGDITSPTAGERLRAGDVVVLSGSRDAVREARARLTSEGAPPMQHS